MEDKLIQETRPCGDCRNFNKIPFCISVCTKKLMTVTSDLKVCYKKQEGTCFEEIPQSIQAIQ